MIKPLNISTLIDFTQEKIQRSEDLMKKPLHETTKNYHDGKIVAYTEILGYLEKLKTRLV